MNTKALTLVGITSYTLLVSGCSSSSYGYRARMPESISPYYVVVRVEPAPAVNQRQRQRYTTLAADNSYSVSGSQAVPDDDFYANITGLLKYLPLGNVAVKVMDKVFAAGR